ncbi:MULTISPECIES: phosphocarrier protein HPr [unclassified Planococcus (in: firmicutes)]|uniref:phosphocarrier protein HPr n=1 Tax=Planococcus TaxID=1372 RepID=UPI000C342BD8|nr:MULTISPECIES: phosphocarrier protein HPr [unclassified Planococcus (in: firmicutes)]MDE4085928.1 phosphocarrier protein HPr [Planococcus maritimus]AUD14462.1 phosphocarrier protein HPr [Planococcus sp. MB-3u-03]PKG44738.1 phosphocarrier protein HPr [Planococcus sp. Urea-trap-24]PKG87081.1 phosphocarrier protein HPr [Planococcus sp. Urea-3u-39]PKH41136.1 phosphocarrier protein HPr [Planococcus sp. MB-3u-09]
MVEKTFTITDPAGMHARPASALVGSLSKFQSDITMEFKDKKVNLKSILGVMSLGVPSGSQVQIAADGADEAEAMETIERVLQEQGISNA